MAEKTLNTRIVHKHDTEANWNLATNFIPKRGELIIYDTDATHNAVRIKIGNGTTKVINLPFTVAPITNAEIDTICGTTIQLAEDVTL